MDLSLLILLYPICAAFFPVTIIEAVRLAFAISFLAMVTFFATFAVFEAFLTFPAAIAALRAFNASFATLNFFAASTNFFPCTMAPVPVAPAILCYPIGIR